MLNDSYFSCLRLNLFHLHLNTVGTRYNGLVGAKKCVQYNDKFDALYSTVLGICIPTAVKYY